MDKGKRTVRFVINTLWLLVFLAYSSEPVFGHFRIQVQTSDSTKSLPQELDHFDSVLVTKQFSHIQSLLRDQNNREALSSSQALTESLLRIKKWDYYIYGLLVQANGQTALLNFGQTKMLLDSAIKMAKTHLGEYQRATATAYNDIALYYINQGEYLEGLKYMQKTVSIRKKIMNPEEPSIGRSLNNLASIYGYLGDYDKEIELLQESVNIKKRALGEYTDAVAIGYNNLAVAYRSKLDFIKALEYIEKVIEIDEKMLPPNHPILAQDYNAISGIHLNLNNEKKAFDFLDKAISINTNKFGMNHPNTAKNMISYSNIYEQQKQFDKQLMYLKKSLNIRNHVYGADHHLVADIYSLLGSCYSNLQQNEDAEVSLKKALKIRRMVFGDNHHLVAQAYNKLAAFFTKKELYDSALLHVQKSIGTLDSSYDFKNIHQNPSADSINSKEVYLEALKLKSLCLVELSKSSADDNFRLSLETNLLSIELINELRMDFDSRLSDKIFFDNSYSIFEKTIGQCFELHKVTSDNFWIEKAFLVSETSKAFRLSKVLNEIKSKQFSRIPDSLLRQEKYLKNMLIQDSESLAKSKSNAEQTTNLKNRIFANGRKLDSLLNQFEKNYPKYYELKYDKNQVALGAVQNDLKTNELLLEFFVGERHIYSFSITKNSFEAHSISKTPLFRKNIKEYRKSISDYHFISDSVLHADTTYVNSSKFLYNYIIKETLEAIEKEIDHLIIVPDGELALINFEALLVSDPEDKLNVDYRNLDYLINHYAISLTPSATVLNQSKTTNSSSTKLYAGFAPIYNNEKLEGELFKMNSSANMDLSGAIKEIEEASIVFGGTKFLDTLASESKFKEVSGNFKLLHLAMHGIIDENPNEITLKFNEPDDGENDGLLRIPEIYNLNLNADMVVLSACNSGFGEVQKGEGVLSLSRAFMYSGSPSVIMSLWALPDNVAPKLIGNFSRKIFDGQMKHTALAGAKINYIKSVEDKFHAHPYFWASLVAIGDMSAVEVDNKNQLKIILGIVALLVISMGLSIVLRRSK